MHFPFLLLLDNIMVQIGEICRRGRRTYPTVAGEFVTQVTRASAAMLYIERVFPEHYGISTRRNNWP